MVLARGAANIAHQLFSWHTGGWGRGFLAHLHSPWGYDEPEILRYSNRHFGPIGADDGQEDARDALARLDPLWEELFPAEQQRIIHALVDRVVVGPSGADIRLRIEGLSGLARDLGPQGQAA